MCLSFLLLCVLWQRYQNKWLYYIIWQALHFHPDNNYFDQFVVPEVGGGRFYPLQSGSYVNTIIEILEIDEMFAELWPTLGKSQRWTCTVDEFMSMYVPIFNIVQF